MFKKAFAIATVAILFAVGCSAHKPRVVRLEGGMNQTESQDSDQTASKNLAIDAGNAFCESEKKHMVVIDQKTSYSGTFDEKTNSAIRMGTRIGAVLGSTEAYSTGRAADDAVYTTVLKFRCE